jgi:hypothetical protein
MATEVKPLHGDSESWSCLPCMVHVTSGRDCTRQTSPIDVCRQQPHDHSRALRELDSGSEHITPAWSVGTRLVECTQAGMMRHDIKSSRFMATLNPGAAWLESWR